MTDPWRTVLGWDPGSAAGAVCVHLLDSSGCIQSTDSIRVSKSTDSDLVEFVREFAPDFALLEKVHAMPSQGVSSSFKFGASFGLAQGILTACAVPWALITPQKWQRPFSVPPSKGAQRKRELKAIAQRLFPAHRFTLEDADSWIIAEYARRVYLERVRWPA